MTSKNLCEVSVLVQSPIICEYQWRNDLWCVCIEGLEVMEKSGALVCFWGKDYSPITAMRKYAEQIQGKNVVIDYGKKNDRNYTLPDEIYVR